MDCYWLFEQNNIDEYVKKLLKRHIQNFYVFIGYLLTTISNKCKIGYGTCKSDPTEDFE